MHLFSELSLIVVIAVLVSFLMRLLRQPLIIGHIATGLVVGPLILDLLRSRQTLALFGEIGIAFLLFIVGINLNPHLIREIGKAALITGIAQMAFTTAIGFFIASALGFSNIPSLYLGVTLAFSSTIIILKLLSDKGDLGKLYARIAIGFLIVQDIIAILILFVLPVVSFPAKTGLSTQEGLAMIVVSILKGIIIILFILWTSKKILPILNRWIARSQEMLFLFSIAWGMGIAALFRLTGFSLESGALIAGIALSTLPSRHEVSARLTPLRDFFIVIFFILLGAQLNIYNLGAILWPAIIFSLLVLIGNPLILMAIMGVLGYTRKVGLQTGFTVAQISEFSLILVALGVALGHLHPDILSLTTLTGLITIFFSTYLILNSDKIYNYLAPYLKIFERKKALAETESLRNYDAILFGYNRIGYDFLNTFRRLEKKFLVIDYDPQVVARLAKEGIETEYGDATDLEFLHSLPLARVRIVVSTIPETETNILIARETKRQNPEAVVLTIAHKIEDAFTLYNAGVDFVIMPHFLGGAYAAEMVERLGTDRSQYHALRLRQIQRLRERIRRGQEHPRPEKFR